MTQYSRIALTLAAAMISVALPSYAADYDPPIVIEDAPEYVPVEVGSGWYLRGDVGYSWEHPFKDHVTGVSDAFYSDRHSPVSFSVGMGYHFNDWIRTELNIGFISSDRATLAFSDADEIASARIENEVWSGMASGFVDLGTFAGVTPYIGGGIGLAYGKRSLEFDYSNSTDPTLDFSDFDRRRNYSVAYSLGAGVAYQMTKNLSVDLGYQYFNAPGLEYATITGVDSYAIRKGIDSHQVKLGLRYDLW
jgi:opacity protein-like surface antigen